MRTEDGYIIHECINGDKSAFALLIDKYKAAVFAIAYSKLLNFQDAEDITQEVFIKAYQKLNNLKHYDRFVVWLHSITNNLCKNFIRSRSRRPDREFIEDQESLALDSPSIESYKDDLVNELIHDALNSLPEIYRQVLSLHYLGGMKDIEIAEFLGMSHTNVRQRLMKARTLLKEEMMLMMNTTFDGQKLQASFTFRVVEMVKHIKIQPVTQMKGLPYGLALTTGLIITFLSLNPYISQLNQIGTITGAPLPSESKVLKVGEIPVDVVKTAEIAILSNKIGKGKGGEPKQPDIQNAFMAPKIEGDTWAQKADMPTARECATTEIDGKIYAIGGTADGNTELSTVEEYDPKTDTWAKKANMPTPRMYTTASTLNGKIYVIGGLLSNHTQLSTVEEYNPKTDTWTKKADMLTPRSMHSAAVVNGKIYVFGEGIALQAVEEYDPALDKWTKKSDIPTGRWSFGSAVVKDKIYAIGGVVNPGFQAHSISNVEEYDPVSDKWTRKADMPIDRTGMVVCAVNDKIYVIAGGKFINGNKIPNLAMNVYDPSTDEWSQKSNSPTIRAYSSGNVVDGKIYVIGGASFNGYLSLVEEYTPEDWKPSFISPKYKLPSKWGELK
jgi:RNA polymerase sigma factor (sigma-70 family)